MKLYRSFHCRFLSERIIESRERNNGHAQQRCPFLYQRVPIVKREEFHYSVAKEYVYCARNRLYRCRRSVNQHQNAKTSSARMSHMLSLSVADQHNYVQSRGTAY